MEQNNKKDHFLLGLLLGAAVGGIVGILYAPNEGSKTRRKLSYQLKNLQNKLKQYLQELKEGKEEHVNLARTKGEQVINDAKEKAEKLLNDVESLMSQIKSK